VVLNDVEERGIRRGVGKWSRGARGKVWAMDLGLTFRCEWPDDHWHGVDDTFGCPAPNLGVCQSRTDLELYIRICSSMRQCPTDGLDRFGQLIRPRAGKVWLALWRRTLCCGNHSLTIPLDPLFSMIAETSLGISALGQAKRYGMGGERLFRVSKRATSWLVTRGNRAWCVVRTSRTTSRQSDTTILTVPQLNRLSAPLQDKTRTRGLTKY